MLTGILLMAVLCAPKSPAQNAPPPSLAKAQENFSAKHYKEAATQSAWLAEHALDPHLRLTAQLLEAKSLVNLPDLPAAEAVLDRYILATPRSSEALYLLGFVLQRENKPKESLAIYTRAAAISPPQPNDLKLVALDYVLLNDYPDAILWLKRSLDGDPANAEAWYFLGRAKMQGGDFVEAEKAFRRALTLAPNDSRALDNLGLSLAAQNRTEDAAQAYKDAIASQPSDHATSEQPFLNLGTLLNDENHSSEALPLLQRAAEIAPRSVRCQEELSRAYLATGNQPEAIASLQRALALDGSNPSLHFRLGQLYRKAGMTEKATAEIQLSSRLYGTHSTAQPQ
ncbi:Tetratricopeptide TPR_1 repeat-containing protein [Granulicella tundricola MP5ACTX9]|uniref:Tetratricopeptide TPR_1 repeat-containing protein n=2 Tax=Granulicella TaxID=940557 RepID=E8WZY5_GRATM|nr:Tetratricopeptide TPR_1 repeat-containing protein [Granulicella tundricola MP5ACTX9]